MNLEWIGLGLAITKMDYIVKVKSTPYAYGFQVETLVKVKRSCTDEQKKCIEVWAQANGMSVIEPKRMYGERMKKWIDTMEPFYSLMHERDVKNIKKIIWMLDNPIPKVAYRDDGTRRSTKIGKNWKKFMHWVEAWDAFCEDLDSSI